VQAESNENLSPGGVSPQRRKRIQRLKKMIVSTIILAILLPTIICIVLGTKLFFVSKELRLLKENSIDTNVVESQEEIEKNLSEETDSDVVQKENTLSGPLTESRKVYLTFDDGPSVYTDDILDILSAYGVKATFFVIGAVDEKYAPMYQRIVEEGHSIGMHSYSHKYTEVYGATEAFKEDFLKIQGLIKEKTGVECLLYRFPGGSSNTIGKENIQEYIAYLEEKNVTYYDWNISSGDATGIPASVEEIVRNSTSQLEKYNSAYILLHDSSTKRSTVEALPIIIETIQAMENTEIWRWISKSFIL
jgi:peptidoglycan/xylan/chitin deacetylase (PgdA/CDA1 family)